MGVDFSINYDNVEHQFDIEMWKVYKATRKNGHEPVSLWLLDYGLMKQKERNKKQRRNYLQHIFNMLQLQMKYQNKSVLYIREISPISKKLGFASERVWTPLSHEKKFSRDEALYITQGIARSMKELHQNSHTAFLRISPDNIFLTSHFTLKFGLFLDAVQFKSENSSFSLPFCPWTPNSAFHLPAKYCAPEIVRGNNIAPKADVYMFGLTSLFVFTGKDPSNATSVNDMDINQPLEACNDLPPEFANLIKKCLSESESSRPDFASIVNDNAFSSLICDIFKYVEIINTKSNRDLFNFFAGLRDIIKAFSFRMLKVKFLPLITFYLKKDVRFSYVLLPMILSMQSKFNDEDFLNKLITPVENVLGLSEPPKIPEILLDYLGVFVRRIPSDKYPKFLYPIITGALKCKEVSVVQQCLDLIPYIINIMDVSDLRQTLSDGLISLLKDVQIPDIAYSAIRIFLLILKKVGPDFIGMTVMPNLLILWQRTKWLKIADIITDLLVLTDVSEETLIKRAIPLGLSILSTSKVDKLTQTRIYCYLIKSLDKFKNENITKEDINQAQNYQIPEYKCPTDKIKEPDDDDAEESSFETEVQNEDITNQNNDFKSEKPGQIQSPSAIQQPQQENRSGKKVNKENKPQNKNLMLNQTKSNPFNSQHDFSQNQNEPNNFINEHNSNNISHNSKVEQVSNDKQNQRQQDFDQIFQNQNINNNKSSQFSNNNSSFNDSSLFNNNSNSSFNNNNNKNSSFNDSSLFNNNNNKNSSFNDSSLFNNNNNKNSSFNNNNNNNSSFNNNNNNNSSFNNNNNNNSSFNNNNNNRNSSFNDSSLFNNNNRNSSFNNNNNNSSFNESSLFNNNNNNNNRNSSFNDSSLFNNNNNNNRNSSFNDSSLFNNNNNNGNSSFNDSSLFNNNNNNGNSSFNDSSLFNNNNSFNNNNNNSSFNDSSLFNNNNSFNNNNNSFNNNSQFNNNNNLSYSHNSSSNNNMSLFSNNNNNNQSFRSNNVSNNSSVFDGFEFE